ncbi:transposase [Corynebacterium diphtheriae]|nr:transposase [Corynebacterium diphtheriae]
MSFYHEFYHIENAFRMAKTDVQARPIFHRTHDAIRAHLTVVMVALAMSKQIYLTCGVTAPKLVD